MPGKGNRIAAYNGCEPAKRIRTTLPAEDIRKVSMRHSAILFLVSFGFAASGFSTEWNQWRGPTRDGGAEGLPSFPKSFNEGQFKDAWKADLAEGYSSPIVSGNRVFTLETSDESNEIARAFDLSTGEQLWERKWSGAMKVPFFAASNGSWVRCTPGTDGKSVYFGGMRDVLVKLDAETGEEIWRVDFLEREGTPLPSFGLISSPLIAGDYLYVQAGSAIAKLDARTGENVWRVLEDERAMFANAFSSPVLAEIDGQKQLVVQNRMNMVGLDIEDGRTLWDVPVKAFRGMNILTPTISGNLIFTASYGGGSMCFKLSRVEAGKFQVSTVWKDEKLEGYMSSPVLVGEHLYLLGRDQKLHCVRLADGTREWTSQEKFGKYWSMIRNGERVMALDQTGELLLFDATPDAFRLLDRRKVSEQETWAHLGLTSDRVLIRSLRGLKVMQWQPGVGLTSTN